MKFYPSMRCHSRKLAWTLTIITITAGVGYILINVSTFETTAFAFRESRLMKTMTELVDPHFGYWTGRYGTIFLLGSIGMILIVLHLWKWNGIPLALALSICWHNLLSVAT